MTENIYMKYLKDNNDNMFFLIKTNKAFYINHIKHANNKKLCKIEYKLFNILLDNILSNDICLQCYLCFLINVKLCNKTTPLVPRSILSFDIHMIIYSALLRNQQIAGKLQIFRPVTIFSH